MRVVLTSHGSTGDIFPMIALGRALQHAGHVVRFATSPPFAAEIYSAGLEFVEIPPRWGQQELAYWMGRLQLFSNPLLQLRELYRAALPHVGELVDAMDGILVDADVLVSSYLFPMNRAIAERRGVPFATFAFAHNTVPSRYYPPEGVPRLRYFPRRVQHTWNRWSWRLGNLAVDAIINRTVARELRSKGLPMVKDFFSKPAELVLVAVSAALMRPPFRVNSRFQFTGYCRWQAPERAEMESDLMSFCQGRRVPVITFGSMVYRDPELWMNRLAAHWPEDRRLIVQSGWAGFQAPAGCRHIQVVGPVSHDQLFRHASVVAHHGGAGTTASALYAGCPQVVVPHIADQHFFAHEIRRLKCGAVLAKAHWPERLAAQVQVVESRRQFQVAAERARRSLAAEDGPTRAVALIEALVARRRLRGPGEGAAGSGARLASALR